MNSTLLSATSMKPILMPVTALSSGTGQLKFFSLFDILATVDLTTYSNAAPLKKSLRFSISPRLRAHEGLL